MTRLDQDVPRAGRIQRFGRSIALGLAVACGDPEPIPFAAHFTVKADEKVPVAGAQITLRGKALGSTDAAGELKVRVRGFDGDRLPIKLACPEGYAASPAESVLILRSVQGLGGEKRRPLLHDLGCQPTRRDAVVLVHVAGAVASLPVKIDGAVVGQTDALGFGHFHLRTEPGARFEVSLDTSSDDKLMPQNPLQVFQVEKSDELFVFDRAFKLPPKPKVHVPIKLN